MAQLEIKSINVFLWSTWGTFGLGILLGVVSAVVPYFMGFLAVQLILAAIFLTGLVVSAIDGSKAAAMKKRLRISLKGL